MMISHDVIVCMGFWQVDVAALPSMEELIGQFASLTHIKKIGEGTFGEAFKSDQVQPCPFAPLPVADHHALLPATHLVCG